MSRKLDSLKPGDAMTFEGPLGNLTYTDRGEFTLFNPASGESSVRSGISHLGLVCGGTGITPMLQVIRQVFKDVGRGLHSFPFQLNLSTSFHRTTQLNS